MKRGTALTGYHAVCESGYPAAIDTAKRFGFDFAQVDLGVPTFFLDSLSTPELDAIGAYAAQQGVELTFHAPGDNVSLFCDYPQVRQGVLAQFLSVVQKANRLGAHHVTFHTGAHPVFRQTGSDTGLYSRTFARHYADVLRENVDTLLQASKSSLICFENDGFTPLVMDVLEGLIRGGKPLYLTLDIAKVYAQDGALDRPVYDFMTKHRERVREVHIHDFVPGRGKHQIVGDGIVDFKLFEEFLFRDSIYMNFEVRPAQAAYESKRNLFALFGKTDGVI